MQAEDGHGVPDVAPPIRVFLSYTRSEIDQARLVIGLLEQNGIDVWWDGLLEGGANYLPTTETALEEADRVVVLWSRVSVDSHWVRDEAQRGRERGCLVPLSLDGTQPPLGFRQFQTIDVQHWTGKQDAREAVQILAAVQARDGTSTPGVPPRSLVAQARPRVSRRTLVLGGTALSAIAAAGAWRLGLFTPGDDDTISMAVLPFASLSDDQEQAWFSNGLSNELRAVLTRNPRLRVSAPASSTASAGGDDVEAGRKLGVRNVLRGTVQRAGRTVRISAELLQVEDGVVRWADSYDRDLTDVFAVQTEIAETVALALLAEIASRNEASSALEQQRMVGGTRDIPAYDAYLRGRAYYELSAGEESDRAALAQFDAAIAADPAFAAAHAMRSTMLAAVANSTSQPQEVRTLYSRAIAAAQRAIALEPRLAQAHLALGFALNNGQLDRKRAFPHYERARKLAPGDADTLRAVALFHAYGAQRALAEDLIGEVLALDPLNARAFRSAGFVAYFLRRHDLTIRRMERALALNPQLASAHYAIGNARYLTQNLAGARDSYAAETVPLFRLTGIALAERALGRRAPASAALEELLSGYGDAALYQQAQIHAQWGQMEQAMDALRKAVAAYDPGTLFAPNDPMLDPLRTRAEFAELLTGLTS